MSLYMYVYGVFVCCVYVYIPGNLRVQYNFDNQNGIPVCKRYSRACNIIVFLFYIHVCN